MTALVLLALAACPNAEVTALEPAARQQAACVLVEQPAPKPAAADRDTLESIFAEPEFAHARELREGALQALIARFLNWLKSLLETREAYDFAEWTRFVVLVVAFVLAGVLAARVLRRRARRAMAPAGDARSDTALELDDPVQHLHRARAALASDAREAIRQALFALLSSLERQRLARPDRVKTNRELTAELPGRGASRELIERVRPLFDWYDGVFYSLAAVSTDEATRFVDRVTAEVQP